MIPQLQKKYRGGINPAGRDELVIYKDPPKSIYTRKYEPVEMGDVTYMIRADSDLGDPSRINESIAVIPKGMNIMAEVDYTGLGRGSQTTHLQQRAPSAPYKVEVVRPPEFPVASLVPLSRPRIHQNYAVQSNPRREPLSIADKYDHNLVSSIIIEDLAGNIRINPTKPAFDTVELNRDAASIYTQDTLSGSVRPSAKYDIATMRETSTLREDATRGDLLRYAVQAPVGFSEIVIVDPKFNTSNSVQSNIQNRNYIALQAALGKPIVLNNPDGQVISIKDYDYKLVQSNMGNSQLVINVRQPDVKLDRETLLYAINTNVGSEAVIGGLVKPSHQKELFRDLPLYAAQPNLSHSSFDPTHKINPNLILGDKLPQHASQTNISGQVMSTNLSADKLKQLQSTLPQHVSQTNISGQVMSANLQHQHMKQLQSTLPQHASQTNITGEVMSNNLTHEQMNKQYNNVLPQTAVTAAYGTQMHNNIQQNQEHNLQHHTPLTAASSHISNSHVWLQTNNPELQLQYNVPMTSASTKVSNLQANLHTVNPDLDLQRQLPTYTTSTNPTMKTGYNEDLQRDGKLKENNKLTHFGSYEDRVSRPVQQINRQVPLSNMIRTKS